MSNVWKIAAAIAASCVVIPAATAATAVEDASKPAKVMAENICTVCHGAVEHAAYPGAPTLAAQPRQYLVAKIMQFRDRSSGKTSHFDLLGLTLADAPLVDALARYFSHQPAPAPVAGDAALVAAGGALYTRGEPDQHLPACAACHGPNGEGLWIFPRLAGQRADYVARQIELIQERSRDSAVMHGVIKTMTPEQIKAVAVFVQSK